MVWDHSFTLNMIQSIVWVCYLDVVGKRQFLGTVAGYMKWVPNLCGPNFNNKHGFLLAEGSDLELQDCDPMRAQETRCNLKWVTTIVLEVTCMLPETMTHRRKRKKRSKRNTYPLELLNATKYPHHSIKFLFQPSGPILHPARQKVESTQGHLRAYVKEDGFKLVPSTYIHILPFSYFRKGHHHAWLASMWYDCDKLIRWPASNILNVYTEHKN